MFILLEMISLPKNTLIPNIITQFMPYIFTDISTSCLACRKRWVQLVLKKLFYSIIHLYGRHHCRWRAAIGPLFVAYDFEQGGIFIVQYLLCYGTSAYTVAPTIPLCLGSNELSRSLILSSSVRTFHIFIFFSRTNQTLKNLFVAKQDSGF